MRPRREGAPRLAVWRGRAFIDAGTSVTKIAMLTISLDYLYQITELGKGRLRLSIEPRHFDQAEVKPRFAQLANFELLEPPMLGAVDLYEFTEAIAPCPRLVDALEPGLFAEPRPVPIIHCRSVSTPRFRPCSSHSFSAARVGPKSA